MTEAKLVKFMIGEGEPKIGPPAGWTVVKGEPEARAWLQYKSDDNTRLAGIWECTPGSFDVVYDKWEFCHLLSGSCVISQKGGEPVHLAAGDGFLLEPGFMGRWEVTETMRKHFVFVAVPPSDHRPRDGVAGIPSHDAAREALRDVSVQGD